MSTTSGVVTWAVIAGLAVVNTAGPARGAMPGLAPAGARPPEGPALTLRALWDVDLRLPDDGVARASLEDLDADGRNEVLVHFGNRDDSSYVVAIGGDGGELWRLEFPARSTAAAADLDGDGFPEVVVACRAELSVFRGRTGERMKVAPLAGIIGDLAVGCLDDMPGADIVYTSGSERDDTLVALFGATLRERWRCEATEGDGPFARGFSKLVVSDVDGDGREEVLAAENGNRLLCFEGSGDPRWNALLGECTRYHPEGVASSLPVPARLYGGRSRELAIGCFAGALVVLDAATGEELDRFQFGVESHESRLRNRRLPRFLRELLLTTGEPVNAVLAVDLDTDRVDELVLGCSDGFLYALDPEARGNLWKVDTRENVYEPCVPIGPADLVGGGGGPRALLAWDALGVYAIDTRTGNARRLLPERGGASTVLVGDIVGDGTPELVFVPISGSTLTAWSVEAASGARRSTSPSGGPEEP